MEVFQENLTQKMASLQSSSCLLLRVVIMHAIGQHIGGRICVSSRQLYTTVPSAPASALGMTIVFAAQEQLIGQRFPPQSLASSSSSSSGSTPCARPASLTAALPSRWCRARWTWWWSEPPSEWPEHQLCSTETCFFVYCSRISKPVAPLILLLSAVHCSALPSFFHLEYI